MSQPLSEAVDPPVTGAEWYRQRAALGNRCNRSPWALASQTFQADPGPVEIAWVRAEHREFFALLATLDDPAERTTLFHEHALRSFWFHEDPDHRPGDRERQRSSYASVLRGWGGDSNCTSGAMLKSWAEDRFGLRAVWHGGMLTGITDRGDQPFARERLRSATTGIGVQLDLLYTMCQDELRRRHPDARWLTLFRGTHDPEAYTVKDGAGTAGGPDQLVEFNTVSSFTADREVAWEFGSRVWRVQVPLAKVVYFNGLLANNLLQGEQEYIVLGGDYLVTPLR